MTTAVTMAAAELGLAATSLATASATSSGERRPSEATRATIFTCAALPCKNGPAGTLAGGTPRPEAPLFCANETVGTLKRSIAARRAWVQFVFIGEIDWLIFVSRNGKICDVRGARSFIFCAGSASAGKSMVKIVVTVDTR